MTTIKGMTVQVKTHSESTSDSNDYLYIGVFGKSGGSEFFLETDPFAGHARGSAEYWYGKVWEGGAVVNASKAYRAEPGDWNDPANRYIPLKDVDYVYLRKQGSGGDDNAWQLDSVVVTLYGIGPEDYPKDYPKNRPPEKRTFWKRGDVWMGYEFGQQVWLVEKK